LRDERKAGDRGKVSMSPTLAQYWHPIGTSEDVTGEPRRFLLLGEALVAFRDEQGPAVFKDLCIHRGAALSLGSVANGHITCPYHGWEYDRTGACVRIPSLPEGQSIPKKARAIAYRAQEAYGLVWVAMEEPVAPVPIWPRDAWNDPRFTSFLTYRCVWKTSAGRAVENFMDFSHFPFVHPGLLGSPDRPVVDPKHVTGVVETEYGITYAYEQQEPGELYASGPELSRYEYSLYLPFTIHFERIEPNGQVTFVTLITQPRSDAESELYTFILRDHSHDVPDEVFGGFTNTVMEQDRVVVESQRPQEIPVDLREELHLKVPDENAVAYRRLLGRIDRAAAFMP
jgi:phenylpropionate dioxygenase-like ring-hydroxylating dioxygenase large terminal subunit